MASMLMDVTFTAQLQETRDRIKSSFKHSHESLVVREMNLLTCVDEIEIDFKNKTFEIQESLSALDKIRSLTSDTQRLIHSTISNKLTELTAVTYNTIVFDWNNQFNTDIEHIGTIKLNGGIYPKHNVPIVPDYREKQLPLIYCCKSSTEQSSVPGVFCNPRGVGVHYKTGRIFIADRDNNRIQIFSRNGDYLSSITNDYFYNSKLTNDVKRPRGICVYQDKLFVTDEHRVSVYELNGVLIKRKGSEGDGEGEFKIPFGLDVSMVNDNIYVCDYNNHRVQIFTEDLSFHSMLGIGVIKSPLAVKITKDNIFVLDESDPCLFVFTSDHMLINRLITRGENKQTQYPADFTIDKGNNILISDLNNQCVLVFSSKGDKIQEIGRKGQGIGEFVKPFGIALDNTGRIVVVCNKDSGCLQIF